jgi:hypothetical protein
MIRLSQSSAILIFASAFLGLALVASAAPPPETSGTSPDGLWQSVEPKAAATAAADRPATWQGPEVFRLFTLRDDVLRQLLARAPVPQPLSTPRSIQPPADITIPLPDGTFAKFRIERSQILAPELAAKFPEIQTYRGQGLDGTGTTVQINIEKTEFHGPASVTWDAAGTEKPPIGTEFVNIVLSIDGGLTFPITLALNASNTGEAQVSLPSVSTATARIRVDSVDNIYFAVSPTNFTIGAGASPPAVLSGARQR